MLKDELLRLLRSGEDYFSGQEMSRRLGVSRAAVWKGMEVLRSEGYAILSAPRKGYRLEDSPDRLSPGELMVAGRAVGGELRCLDSVDSTNNECRRLAVEGAADGLVVIAEEQVGGKGRQGRSFVSTRGAGVFLSVLLRPRCDLAQVTNLTAWVAVAVCDAVEAVCGIRPGIKWTNDIILNGKKLCGILTELGLVGETGALDYVVAGMGINVSQSAADFGPTVAPVAISLGQVMDKPPRRAEVARALLDALEEMYSTFPAGKARYLSQYRADCVTVGREVKIIRGEAWRVGFAEAIDDDFSLVVRWPDGTRETVRAGEVSVRGMLGYAE